MVRGRVSHSIDIGKELENEQPQEPKQEAPKQEETASKEEALPEEPEKPQEQPAQASSEPQHEASERPVAEATVPSSAAQELLDTTAEPAPEPEDEDVPEEPAGPPDPVEEDVNEIITKGVPRLQRKQSFWKQVKAYRTPLFILFVILVGGWFLLRAMGFGAGQQETTAPPPALGPLVVSNGTPLSTLSENKTNTEQDSRGELAAILVRGLRD